MTTDFERLVFVCVTSCCASAARWLGRRVRVGGTWPTGSSCATVRVRVVVECVTADVLAVALYPRRGGGGVATGAGSAASVLLRGGDERKEREDTGTSPNCVRRGEAEVAPNDER